MSPILFKGESMKKTLRLQFTSDAWFNGNLVYKSGEIHEVTTDLGWANRWVIRGANILEDEIKEETKAETKAEPKVELIVENSMEVSETETDVLEAEETQLKEKKRPSKKKHVKDLL